MSVFLRNPEVQRDIALYLAAGAALIAAGFIISAAAGVLAIAADVIFAFMHFLSSYRRYRAMVKLSQDIDQVLHGDFAINFSSYSEGELSVLENELTKMVSRLRQSLSLLQDDKTQLYTFIADISHQLRTPLTSINLTVTLLSESELDTERRLELLRELRTMLARISWLIESLLRMSRLDAGMTKLRCERVELATLLEKAAEPLAVPFEVRDITLDSSLSGGFDGDLPWSAEAVGNILKNAMEHMPEGGRIIVRGSETAIFTELTIRDTGPGFDSVDLPHVFQRFYRGKYASNGSFGIGLSLARTIITSQNGTIKAENAAQGGALFTIRFYKGII